MIAEPERQRPPYVAHRSGHIEAWDEIVTLTPVAAEHVCHVGMRAGADANQYFDVNGTTAGSNEELSITFADWRQWMIMELVIDDTAVGGDAGGHSRRYR